MTKHTSTLGVVFRPQRTEKSANVRLFSVRHVRMEIHVLQALFSVRGGKKDHADTIFRACGRKNEQA